MKKWIILLIGIVCFSLAMADTLTYGPENYLKNRRNILSGSTTSDPLYLFINEVDDTLGGTESVNFLLFNPTTEPGTPAAGQFYFDTASNTMKFANNSATFVALAAASGNSLDQSYDAGIAITVDAGAVALTATDAANNVALAIAQSDTGTSKAITITNAGSGNSLDFQGTSGFDIQGTDDSWTASIAGIFDGEGLTGVTNSQGILFDTNNEIQFGAASEDVAMDFATSNTLKWRSDTAVDTMDFGTVDTLIDLEDITFDAASASIITQAGSGDADDLTIRQTGTVDVSLILSSAGSITDALSILTTDAVGVIKISSSDILDIDAVDNINMDISGAGANLDIDSALGSVYIDGGEAAANAIVIDASNAAGGIDLDYGTGNFVITGTGASADLTIDADLISIDGTGASNITFTNGADEDVTIATAGAADHSLIISATGTAADAMQITTSAGGIDITNGGASGEDLDIDGVLSAVNINSDEAEVDAVTITATGGGIDLTSAATFDIDITATGGKSIITGNENALDAVTLTTGGGGGTSETILIINDQGNSVTEDDGAIQLTATAGGIQIQSDANLDDAVVIRADGGAAAEITIHNDQATTSDSIELVSDEGGILVDSGADDAITLTAGTGGVVFTSGQTRRIIYMPGDVIVDPTVPPGTTNIGTTEQAYFETLNFDANPNATGDDVVFINWVVPPGYITDSASLNVYWTHSDAEDAADEIDIDGAVNAIAPGEDIDAAGTAMVAVTSVIADASASAGKLVVTSLDIEVEDIVIGDLVNILFFVDESASLMAASGTADVHYFEIEYESSE